MRLVGKAHHDRRNLAILQSAEHLFAAGAILWELLTGRQMAEKLSRALGEEVRYHAMDPDVYRGLGFPGADLIGNMFHFKRDFEAEYAGPRDHGLARELDPELQDFDTWLAENAARIPIAEKTAGAQKFPGYFNLYWDAKQGKLWLEIDKWGTEFLYQSGLSAGLSAT